MSYNLEILVVGDLRGKLFGDDITVFDKTKNDRIFILSHCLSQLTFSPLFQWGHDFRPDYLELKNIRTLCPSVPIMALTATANQSVVRDCMAIIGMREPFVHTQSFNRGNLRWEFL